MIIPLLRESLRWESLRWENLRWENLRRDSRDGRMGGIGMKNTPQRLIVERTVREMHDHPTADDVYEKVLPLLPTISKATVYRILNALEEEGALHKIRVPGSADRFDDDLTPHSHIRCVKCGRIEDVQSLFLPDTGWITDPKGFQVLRCVMSFEGVCPECLKNQA